MWDAVDGGLAEPTRATISHGHQHTVGGDASVAGLEEARRCDDNGDERDDRKGRSAVELATMLT